MSEQELQQTLEKFNRDLPHFPDGRIDYSDADAALAVGIVVVSGETTLLVRRSREVSFYPGKWNWVSGFIDEAKPLREFVYQELQEETGIPSSRLGDYFAASKVEIVDNELPKTWLVYPVVVTVAGDVEPELNWEAGEYAWVRPDELETYDTVPGVGRNIQTALRQYNAQT